METMLLSPSWSIVVPARLNGQLLDQIGRVTRAGPLEMDRRTMAYELHADCRLEQLA
jgi:hypothetical protein